MGALLGVALVWSTSVARAEGDAGPTDEQDPTPKTSTTTATSTSAAETVLAADAVDAARKAEFDRLPVKPGEVRVRTLVGQPFGAGQGCGHPWYALPDAKGPIVACRAFHGPKNFRVAALLLDGPPSSTATVKAVGIAWLSADSGDANRQYERLRAFFAEGCEVSSQSDGHRFFTGCEGDQRVDLRKRLGDGTVDLAVVYSAEATPPDALLSLIETPSLAAEGF
jgi:hypothetical protein